METTSTIFLARTLAVAFLLQCIPMVIPATIDEYITGAAETADQFAMLYSDTGDVLVELDMFLTNEQWQAANRGSRYRGKRKAIRSQRYRWTDKTIPYQFFSGQFSSYEQSIIRRALSEWEKYTCVKFKPAASERNRIVFQNGGGCSSYVGMIGGSQPVTLGRGCRVREVVIHEVGHAVGFQHEQTRPDRDSYVTIKNNNIPANLLFNFNKYSISTVNNYEVPYDYRSIMHYGAKAFSINGLPTIIAKDSSYQNIMGKAKGLSFRDIKLANLMYSCSENCGRKGCPDEGFMGKDCRCYCPGNPVKVCTENEVATRSTTTRSTTARTTTVESKAQCADRNIRCQYLVNRGECTRNKGFMLIYCKKSCDLCDEDNSIKCEDLNQNCVYWSSRGYCLHYLYGAYMRNSCPKSCSVCSDKQDRHIENTTKANKYTTKYWYKKNYTKTETKNTKTKNTSENDTPEADCRDKLSYCSRWLEKGYCTKNPSYMKRSCQKSCNLC